MIHQAVILTAVIYCGEIMKIKISKGKGSWSEVQRKPGANFQESAPSGVRHMVTSPSYECDNTCEMLSTREAH